MNFKNFFNYVQDIRKNFKNSLNNKTQKNKTQKQN